MDFDDEDLDQEEIMPCGECCVCNKYLDHSDTAFCIKCKCGFHWRECGDWGKRGHICENCKQNG